MSATNDWTHQRLPMWAPQQDASPEQKAAREEAGKNLEAIPFRDKAPRGSYDFNSNMQIFHDPEQEGRLVRGFLTGNESLSYSMADDYTRGIFSRNSQHDVQAAQAMLGGTSKNLKDTKLAYDSQFAEFIDHVAGGSSYNIYAQTIEGDAPIVNIFMTSPEDLFQQEPPDNWNTEEALDLLKEHDPVIYAGYAKQLGGEDRLKAIVEDARNPYEFFYELGRSANMHAVGKSMEIFERDAGSLEQNINIGHNFIVSGILNDPDMLAGLAISAGIGLATGGVGGVIAASALLTVKAAKYANRANRVVRIVGRLGKYIEKTNADAKLLGYVGKAKKAADKAISYFPENLGPTLLKNHIVGAKRYENMGGAWRYLADRGADTIEGAVSGSLAETFNQKRQINQGKKEGFDYGVIFSEGVTEALISGPGHLNFVVGKAYTGIGKLTGGAGTFAADLAFGESEQGHFKAIQEQIGKVAKFANADYLTKASETLVVSRSIRSRLDSLLTEEEKSAMMDAGEGGDPYASGLFNSLVGLLSERQGGTAEETLAMIDKTLAAMLTEQADTGKKVTLMELAATLAENAEAVTPGGLQTMSGDNPNSTAIESVVAEIELLSTLHKNAKEKGMSLSDYMQDLKDNDAYFDVLPAHLKEAVQEKMGDKFEGATQDEKIEAAAKISKEAHDKALEDLKKPAKRMQKAVSDIQSEMEKNGVEGDLAVEGAATPDEQAANVTSKAREAVTTRMGQLQEEGDSAPPTPEGKDARQKAKKKIKNLKILLDKIDEMEATLKNELETMKELTAFSGDEESSEMVKRLEAIKERIEKVQERIDAAGGKELKELEANGLIFGILTKTQIEGNEELPKNKKGHRQATRANVSKEMIDALTEINKTLKNKAIEKFLQGSGTLSMETAKQWMGKINNEKERLQKTLAKTEFKKEEGELIAEQEQLMYSLLATRNEAYRRRNKKELRSFHTVQLLQELKNFQTKELNFITVLEKQLQSFLDSKAPTDVVSLEEFFDLLPSRSKFKRNLEKEMKGLEGEARKKYMKEKLYSISALRKKKEGIFKSARNSVKSVGRGKSLLDGSNFFPRESNTMATFQDEVTDDSFVNVPTNPEYLNKNDTSPAPLSGVLGTVVDKADTNIEDVDDLVSLVMYTEADLSALTLANLKKVAKSLGLRGYSSVTKASRAELEKRIFNAEANKKSETTAPKAEAKAKAKEEAIDPAELWQLNEMAREYGFEDYNHALNAFYLYHRNAYTPETINQTPPLDREEAIKSAKFSRDKLTAEEKTRRKELAAEARAQAKGSETRKKAAKLSVEEQVTFARNLSDEVNAFAEFEMNLMDLQGMEGVDRNGVAAFRIYAAMPRYLRSFGLGPEALFVKMGAVAELNLPNYIREEIDGKTDDEVILILREHAPVIRYELSVAISIMKNLKERGAAKLGGWEGKIVDNILEIQEQQLEKRGDPASIYNLEQTIYYLKVMEGVTSKINSELFESSGRRFILTLDPVTGNPRGNRTQNLDAYERAVRETIKERVTYYALNEPWRIKGMLADGLAANSGIEVDPSSANIGNLIGPITDFIYNNGLSVLGQGQTETRRGRVYEISIENFGNGVYAMSPADSLGKAIVDSMLRKEMPGKNNVVGMKDRNGQLIRDNNENQMTDGASVQTSVPVEGSLHMAMPLPLWKIAALTNDFRYRRRVRAVLKKKNFTDEEVQMIEEWKSNYVIKEGVQVTGGEAFTVFPTIVNGKLTSKVMSREKALDLMLYLTLDIPRKAEAFIHDQVITEAGLPVRFRGEGDLTVVDPETGEESSVKTGELGGRYQEGITHGDELLVPFDRIGEWMAIGEMNPMFEGMTEASIKFAVNRVERFKEKWEEQNPGKKWNSLMAFDPANHSDRNASGAYELKLHSLAFDDESTIELGDENLTIPQYVDRLINDSEQGIVSSLTEQEADDFYKRAGIRLSMALANKGKLSRLGKLGKALSFITDNKIKTFADWERVSAESEENKKKLDALREFFKVPVLRRWYSGGRKNFNNEFLKSMASPTSEGMKALSGLQEAFGLEQGDLAEGDLNALGALMYNTGAMLNGRIAIDEAINLGGEIKENALKLLALNGTIDKPALESWQEFFTDIDGKVTPRKVSEKLAKIEETEKLLDAQLKQLAIYSRVDIKDDAAMEKFIAKHKESYGKAKAYLKELREQGIINLPFGSDEYNKFRSFFLPETDSMTAKDVAYFRGLNIMASQGFRINVERTQAIARGLGFESFDMADFLGLDENLMFMTAKPTATSHRTYNAIANFGINTMGLAFERVALVGEFTVDGKSYDSFETYLKTVKAEVEAKGQEYTEENLRQDITKFLEVKDNDKALGMLDLEGDFEKNVTEDQFIDGQFQMFPKGKRENARAYLENMLMKQELLHMATQDKLPIPITDENGPVNEDNDMEYIEDALRDFQRQSEKMDDALQRESDLEMAALKRNDTVWLENRNKLGGLVNIDVVRTNPSVYKLRPYHAQENRGSQNAGIEVRTAPLKGPMAATPLSKQSSYYDMGIFALQRWELEQRRDERTELIRSMEQKRERTGQGMLAEHSGVWGWTSPWREADLPRNRVHVVDPLNITERSGAAKRAVQMVEEVSNWAIERGYEKELENPEFIPFFYVTMESERVWKRIASRELRSEDQVAEEQDRRVQWLQNLHNITRISRNMKNNVTPGRALESKGMEVPIVNPANLSDREYADLLTSIASENNPDGVLYLPTKLHKQLKMGVVPVENLIMTDGPDEGQNLTDMFEFTDISFTSQLVQGADFQKFLASILYREYIGLVLKDMKDADGNPLYLEGDVWKKPELWETHVGTQPGMETAKHRVEIVEKAKLLAQEGGGLDFDITLGEELRDPKSGKMIGYRATLTQQHATTRLTSGEVVDHEASNALAGIGFDMLGASKTNLKGSTAKLSISIKAALNMFALLENHRILTRIQYAEFTNKAYGVELDENGDTVRAVPMQDVIQDLLGHTERRDDAEAVEESEALLRASGKENETNNSLKVVKGESSEGRQMNVVDLDYYRIPVTQGWSPAWLESFYSPISKVISQIKNAGFYNTDSDAGNLGLELEAVIKAAREGDTSAEARAIILGVLTEVGIKSSNIFSTVRSFLDPNVYSDAVVRQEIEKAESIYRRITAWKSDDSWMRTSPYYWQVREFLSSYEGDGTDLDAAFLRYLERPGSAIKFDRPLDRTNKTDNTIIARINALQGPMENYGDPRKLREQFAIKTLRVVVGDETNKEMFRGAFKTETEMDININEIGGGSDNQQIDVKVAKYARDQKSFMAFVEKLKETDMPTAIKLGEINEFLNQLKDEGYIDETQAKLVRAMVLRAGLTNRDFVKDLKFQLERTANKHHAIKDGADFFVRIGGDMHYLNGPKTLGQDKLDVVLMFAHELSHIGRMKFIADNGGEFARFEALMNSDAGRSFLRKQVLAWHNNRWTPQAEAEFNKYMSDPEEFIAALGSFYLIKEINPLVQQDITPEQAEVKEGAMRIVQGAFSYIKGFFSRLAGVWVTYEAQNPELMENVNDLMTKLLGYEKGRDGINNLDVQVANKDQKLGFMGSEEYQSRLNKNDITQEQGDEDFQKTLREIEPIRRKQERNEDLTADEAMKLNRFISELEADPNENVLVGGQFGLTREEYFTHLPRILNKYSTEINREKVFDIEKLLRGSSTEGDAGATNLELSVALQYIVFKLEDHIGTPYRRGLGKTGGAIGEGKARSYLMGAVIGGSGAEFTFDSKLLVVTLLTNLIDDQIAVTSGQKTNMNGLKSTKQVLASLEGFTQAIKSSHEKIESLFYPLRKVLLGEKAVSEAKAEEYIRDVDTQITIAIENPDHEFEFTQRAEQAFGEKEGLREEVIEQMTIIVKSFRLFIDYHIKDGQEVGKYAVGFKAAVPYRLTNKISNKTTEFNDNTLTKVLGNKMRSNLLENATESGFMDGVTLTLMGAIPDLGNVNEILSFAQRGQRSPEGSMDRGMFEFIIEQILVSEGVSEGDLRAKRAELLTALSSTRNIEAIRRMREGVRNLYQRMARKQINFSQLGKFLGSELRPFLESYKKFITNDLDPVTKNQVRERSSKMYGQNRGAYLPYYVAYNGGSRNSKVKVDRAKDNVINVHLYNFMNRASQGQYLPNDNWIVPKVGEIAAEPGVREFLVINPVSLSSAFQKGLADEVGETKMMKDTFDVRSTVGQLLTLFQRVAEKPHARMTNWDGTPLSSEDAHSMVESSKILKEKYNFMKGVIEDAETTSTFEKFLFNYAPGMTKIAFGSNLALATVTVEQMFSSMVELFGRGNLGNFLYGVFGPILNVAPSKQKYVANDLSNLVETLTKAYVPEYEKPSSAVAKGWVANQADTYGYHMMRPAQLLMKSIAMSQALAARKFLVKKQEKLKALVQNLEANPMKRDDPGQLDKRMKEVGLSPWRDGVQVTFLLNSGLLTGERFSIMTEMISRSQERIGENYYSPADMMAQLVKEEPDQNIADERERFYLRNDVITALKRYELLYVEDNLTTPNAFDVYTGSGELRKTWEIFRRYPSLFAAQQMIRKASRRHPLALATRLISLMLLDIIYMIALRVSNGDRLSDVIEQFKEDPWKTSSTYFTRLPILGVYGGIAAEGLQMMFGGKYGATPGAFIPAAAAVNVARQIKGVGESILGMNKYPGQTAINATKLVPWFGSSIVRLGFYVGTDDLVARRTRSSRGSAQGGSSYRPTGHYGLPPQSMSYTWNHILGNILSEIAPPENYSNPHSEYAHNKPKNIFGEGSKPSGPIPQPEVPSEPQEAPVQASQPKDIVGSLEEAGKPQEAPEGLI